MAKKEGVPDINTDVGYQTLKALCPGKSRVALSNITANCLKQNSNGNIDCDSCLEGKKNIESLGKVIQGILYKMIPYLLVRH